MMVISLTNGTSKDCRDLNSTCLKFFVLMPANINGKKGIGCQHKFINVEDYSLKW